MITVIKTLLDKCRNVAIALMLEHECDIYSGSSYWFKCC